MPFAKGQSGNPNGRPPNSRMLAELLRDAGNVKVKKDGHFVPRSVVVAENIWQLLTEGECELLRGASFKISGRDYLELVRFAFGHIDGPVRQDVDINITQVKTYIGFSPDEWDDDAAISISANKAREITQGSDLDGRQSLIEAPKKKRGRPRKRHD